MARPLRLHVPFGFYHVTLRGNHRQPIFDAHSDRLLLEKIVAEAISELDASIHAYCWMTNHIHMLVQIRDTPLGKLILRIASQYARKFQASIATTGHLFERRYHGVLVDAERYLLTLLRYIHLNPVRAGLVTGPLDYPWSSHGAYLGLRPTPWICTRFALRLFSPDLVTARCKYRDFIDAKEMVRWGEGELVTHPENSQVLGDDEFLSRMTAATGQGGVRISLDELVNECSRRFDISVEVLTSSSRARRLSAARAWLSHESLNRGIATTSAVARFLGRSESAVRALMQRHPQSAN